MKAVPQVLCSSAEGSISHGAVLSTRGPEEQATGFDGVGGGLWAMISSCKLGSPTCVDVTGWCAAVTRFNFL